LLTDQKVRIELIQEGDQAAEKLQKALEALEESKGIAPDDKSLAAIRDNLQELRSAEATVASHRIPIGWETAPWHQTTWKECTISNLLSSACAANIWNVITWAFYVFLGGVLVGLGGPFWFDTFTRLSGLVRRVRNPQTPVQQAKEGATGKEGGTRLAAPEPLNLPQVFEEAARAALTAHLGGRPVLGADGSVIREEQP
jgi:hypothetical protein